MKSCKQSAQSGLIFVCFDLYCFYNSRIFEPLSDMVEYQALEGRVAAWRGWHCRSPGLAWAVLMW